MLLASLTSGMFADQNHYILYPLAAVLNIVVFSIAALPIYFALRRRAPRVCVTLLLVWLVFYLCSLFFLFPATDGP